MKKDGPNISKVASDLILAYKQLTGQQNEIVISPRYEKTALYFPQSPIEEQIEEENQLDSPRKTYTENEDDYLKEISELRQIVDQIIRIIIQIHSKRKLKNIQQLLNTKQISLGNSMGKFNDQVLLLFFISYFCYFIYHFYKKIIIMSSLLTESIASAISGIIGKFLCYPLDTVKAQFYVERKPIQMNLRDVQKTFKNVYQQGGIKQFYKGGLIAIIGSGPAFSLYLTSYQYFKIEIGHKIESKLLLHLCCGLLAETVSGVLWLPIDVVKERLQVQKRFGHHNYSGSIDAVLQIVKQEGILGLYRGFGATLGFFGPYSALYFASFEYLKEQTNNHALLSSLGAFFFSSILTQPLSVSKMRIQIQSRKMQQNQTGEGLFNYKNQLHGIWRILIDEGIQALFRGYVMRCLYAGSLTTFNMTCAELLKNYANNKI
ncbi:unnamed protein product [Paramecium pentaurelia]|uniref:Mitochondrial carrier protein n=1 Tax=Paramecium pentaurelia TaxID=43138 RepID=A0A8S1TR93_9CILI|nr:unnamed protein product [Paramecium pentaurelia]